MVTRNAETNQGDGGLSSAPPPQTEPAPAPVASGPPPAPTPAPAPPSAQELRSRAGNQVFKSGPLFISSKGIGWTSWKKRWFILTRTSLVFFRSDPSAIPQKGSEVNLTLGGIDLNNSGSVVVREDKKLLTVLFPDGRDGRAFTLKAETSEDLLDWKAALETALAQAPSAALVMGQNGIFRNDQSDAVDEAEQWKDRQPVKSLVVGRPILLALEDIDGAPSFLEKALTFIEQYGVKTEGILRQAADVDDVNRRVREYEEGKTEFTAGEDAHVIADCVKHVLRGLPSSPVPASCCNALLEACRADHRGVRVQAMRDAITETFPEPNRKLLQRVLKMMQIVASYKSDNRMSSSAVAACMAPLLLRPLLAGDCDLENDFNMGGDGSVQLLQAAAAANHAQAIVITLMEDYDKIFGDDSLHGSLSPEQYSGSEGSGDEGDELTDDEEILIDDDDNDDEDDDFDSQNDSGAETENDHEDASSGTYSESVDGDRDDTKPSEGSYSGSGSAEVSEDLQADQRSSPDENVESKDSPKSQKVNNLVEHARESQESVHDVPAAEIPAPIETGHFLPIDKKPTNKVDRKPSGGRRQNIWGRTAARKNLSMESIDYSNDDEEIEIQKLEESKTELKNKIAKEVKENAVLHASLKNRKKALQERRLALEKDVAGLQEQLQKEKHVRAAIEARLNAPLERSAISPIVDDKTKAELEEISQVEEDISNLKNKVADLHLQLDEQCQHNSGSGSCSQPQQSSNNQGKQKDEVDAEASSVAPLKEKTTKSEDVSSSTDRGDVKTQETSSLLKKQLSEGTKSVGASGESSMEPATNATNASSNSKKSGSKAEGNVSTSSALSKLTTRLNFLKERRTQIVNELQNIDTARGAADNPVATPPPRTGSR